MAEPRARIALRCCSAAFLGFALGSLLIRGGGDNNSGDGQHLVQDPAMTMAALPRYMQPTAGARLPVLQSLKPSGMQRAPMVGPWKPLIATGNDLARHHPIAMAKMERRRNPQARNPKLQPKMPEPPVDPENEEFVVFVRSKKFGPWIPCTMVKGSAVANNLVKAIDQQLSKDTLIRNVGQSIYENKKDLIKGATKMSPALAIAQEIEFGFKVRDKTVPADWYKAVDIIPIPPKDQLPKAPLDGVGETVENIKDSFSKMFRGAR